MAEEKDLKTVDEQNVSEEQQYSLNDDRRVKVLSPGAMVAKRFFRNRTAVFGMSVLIFMFLFAFVGGLIIPYGESELFYRTDYMQKEYASALENKDFRFRTAEGQEFSSVVQAKMVLAINTKADTFEWSGVTYKLTKEADDLYTASLQDGTVIGMAYKAIFSAADANTQISFELQKEATKAFINGETSFKADGVSYKVDEDGNVTSASGQDMGYISTFNIQPFMADIFLTREFKERVAEEIEAGNTSFKITEADGTEVEYLIKYEATTNKWAITRATASRVYDTYASPSKEHLLGTDKYGMDVLTRLMYGGRVSLVIGFVVEFIATAIALVLGGIAGYFGGWVDNLIMRIVDIFYCIPSMPIIIILGAAMDNGNVPPKTRMIYLMLILGVLGWPGLARLIRGQILSLREQEFMTATEATGLSVRRRIFQHLIPNVIPQTIVSVTMGLGGTILTESSLSFLGLGVKFPFASWGNIINDVNNTYVLQNFWFIWIPAGVLLLATVLAFNLVGDGLRDAFDPKMKR